LEAYRALGFHIMKGLLAEKTPFAVEPRRNETEGETRLRILMAVRESLLGTEVESPDTRDEINHEDKDPSKALTSCDHSYAASGIGSVTAFSMPRRRKASRRSCPGVNAPVKTA
jgi:hypothetical protein